MRILVCGSRHFKDYNKGWEVLSEYADKTCDMTFIHGDADGADRFCDFYSWYNGYKVERYPADWEKHGKAAGPVRNREMLERGKPDLVIAFLAPGSRGTANMVRQAKEAGVPVKIINIME